MSFDEIIEKMKETVLSVDMLTASPDFETLTEPTEYEVMNLLQSHLWWISWGTVDVKI